MILGLGFWFVDQMRNWQTQCLCEIVELEKKTIIRLIPLQANNCLLSNFLFFFIVQEKILKKLWSGNAPLKSKYGGPVIIIS